MIWDAWVDMGSFGANSLLSKIALNLKHLKHVVHAWERQAKHKMKEDFIQIDLAMNRLANLMNLISPSSSHMSHLQELEWGKRHILKLQEATWMLKIQSIWLKEGDRNTHFSTQRKNRNSIREMESTSRGEAFSTKDIKKGSCHIFGGFNSRPEQKWTFLTNFGVWRLFLVCSHHH